MCLSMATTPLLERLTGLAKENNKHALITIGLTQLTNHTAAKIYIETNI